MLIYANFAYLINQIN